jgi:lysophospholipase L1-like esterase
MRDLLSRLALALFGIVVGVLAVELVLQLGALALRPTPGLPGPSRGGLRVLCLGDSNTYGVYVSRDATWPRQLDALWRAAGRQPDLEVVNVGVPGASASRLVRELPTMLATFAPDLALAMIGVNDFWTLPATQDDPDAGARFLTWLWQHSRLYRLYRSRAARDLVAEVELGATEPARRGQAELRAGGRIFEMSWRRAPGRGESAASQLAGNLRSLAREAREQGVPLIFVTYASDAKLYAKANLALRGAARETSTPLIEVSEVFRRRCPDPSCPELLMPDGHPKRRGYSLLAETIAARLPELLGAQTPDSP